MLAQMPLASSAEAAMATSVVWVDADGVTDQNRINVGPLRAYRSIVLVAKGYRIPFATMPEVEGHVSAAYAAVRYLNADEISLGLVG